MKAWQRDSQMVLQRNPSYWQAARPYLDQRIVKPVPDEASCVNALIAGESQVLVVCGNEQAQRCCALLPQNGWHARPVDFAHETDPDMAQAQGCGAYPAL